jgi:hypothetical protein
MKVTCTGCAGTGTLNLACSNCNGGGVVGLDFLRRECEHCSGTGHNEHLCDRCGGTCFEDAPLPSYVERDTATNLLTLTTPMPSDNYFVHSLDSTPTGIRIDEGTIISGTHRWQDLFEALFDTCRLLEVGKPDEWEAEMKLPAPSDEWRTDDEADEDAAWVMEDLFNALDGICTGHWYFGAHPGDGSDYGFWRRDPNEEVSREIIAEAKKRAGAHRQIPDFSWGGEPEDGENWMLYHLAHRDSDFLSQSNTHYIEKNFPDQEDMVDHQSFSHWAVGWIDAVAIRVYDAEGAITEVFQKFYEDVIEALEQYPVLDEDHYSQLEWEDEQRVIEEAIKSYYKWECPLDEDEMDQAIGQVAGNNESDRFGGDGGSYPSDEEIFEALAELNLPLNNQAVARFVFSTPHYFEMSAYLCEDCRRKVPASTEELERDENIGKVMCDICDRSISPADLGIVKELPSQLMDL